MPYSALSHLFPLELTDMFIDNLSDNMAALRDCSLVHSRWLPRSRFHLFKTIVVKGRKLRQCLFLYHTPRKLENEVPSSIRNLAQCLVLDHRFKTEGVQDDQVRIDITVVRDFLKLLPNINHLALSAAELQYPNLQTCSVLNPQEQRRLKCLEISVFNDQIPHLYDLLSLFSEIDTVYISHAHAGVDNMGLAVLPSFPKIRQLYLLNEIGADFVRSLFCGSEPSRLASLEYLSYRCYTYDGFMEFNIIAKEVGKWLPRLEVDVTDEIFDTVEGQDEGTDSDVIDELGALWSQLFTWDLCPALEEMTIHCEICFSAQGDQYVSPIVMPGIITLLEDIARSEHVCESSTPPLSMSLVLEIREVVATLVDYFHNTPWDRFKNALVNLHKHRNIRLGRFMIQVIGYHGVDLDEEDDEIAEAISVLQEGIQKMGLGFVEGPVVRSGSTRDLVPRWRYNSY